MTYAEITNKRKGIKLRGKLCYGPYAGVFEFQIEGTSASNGFYDADWDVREIPEPFEFPTKPLAIIKATHFYDPNLTDESWRDTYLVRGGGGDIFTDIYGEDAWSENYSIADLNYATEADGASYAVIFEGIDL